MESLDILKVRHDAASDKNIRNNNKSVNEIIRLTWQEILALHDQ
jgi:hypothetical protein